MFKRGKIKIRELHESDFDRGFFELLGSKHYLGTIPRETVHAQFNRINKNPNQFIYIVEKDKEIIGTAVLLIFQKLSQLGRNSGKIEDMIISQEHSKYPIEHEFVKELFRIAKSKKCDDVYFHNNKPLDPIYLSWGLKNTNRTEFSNNDDV